MTDPELSHLPDPPAEVEVAVLYAGRTPRERTVRTVLQVVVGVLLAIPSAMLALTTAGVDVPAGVTALVVGGSGAVIALLSAGQNAFDQAKGRG